MIAWVLSQVYGICGRQSGTRAVSLPIIINKKNKCYLAFFVMLCTLNTARGNISHLYKTAKSLLCILLTCQEAFEMVVVFKLDNVKEFLKPI
jgi:hypothetical protein